MKLSTHGKFGLIKNSSISNARTSSTTYTKTTTVQFLTARTTRPTHTYEKFLNAVMSRYELSVMFGTHHIRPSVGIMRTQPGCSNHNLRVPGTQCVDGAIHLCLNVMVGNGLLDHGRVHDSAGQRSSTSVVFLQQQPSLCRCLSVLR